MIMRKKPCEEWTEKVLRECIGDGITVLEILDLKNVSIPDRIWCVTQFLPDIVNRKFAIWCARQCKTNNFTVKKYIDIIEKYYIFKTATKKEMQLAKKVAYYTVNMTGYWTAYWTAFSTAYRVTEIAAGSAANWTAETVADNTVNWIICRKKQIKKLRKLIKEEK